MIHVEHEPGSEIRVPRAALFSMAALVVISMILAGAGRLTGTGTVGHLQLPPDGTPVLVISFVGDADGDVTVVDASTGRVLEELGAGEGGFLRGVLRPLERERMRRSTDRDGAYELRRNVDGSLVLRDPLTDVSVDVAAFGATSARAFTDLLRAAVPQP